LPRLARHLYHAVVCRLTWPNLDPHRSRFETASSFSLWFSVCTGKEKDLPVLFLIPHSFLFRFLFQKRISSLEGVSHPQGILLFRSSINNPQSPTLLFVIFSIRVSNLVPACLSHVLCGACSAHFAGHPVGVKGILLLPLISRHSPHYEKAYPYVHN
jgi:hypothetical protein